MSTFLNESKDIVNDVAKGESRDYNNCSDSIRNFYRDSRSKQTVEYVQNMHKWYENKPKVKFDIWKAILMMAEVNDSSDPDISLSNIHHIFQVAESLRHHLDDSPESEWIQVVGLIHDLGKIMYMFGTDESGTTIENQWGVVGDTFIVGCPIPDSVVFPEFNELNPDTNNAFYTNINREDGKYGMYDMRCGLSKTLCSWGHDEYLYRVLCDNQTPLAQNTAAMYMIRYHSLYPWHRENEYADLLSEEDKSMLSYVKLLNTHDLYTKVNVESDPEALKAYYLPLLEKYVGEFLYF